MREVNPTTHTVRRSVYVCSYKALRNLGLVQILFLSDFEFLFTHCVACGIIARQALELSALFTLIFVSLTSLRHRQDIDHLVICSFAIAFNGVSVSQSCIKNAGVSANDKFIADLRLPRVLITSYLFLVTIKLTTDVNTFRRVN